MGKSRKKGGPPPKIRAAQAARKAAPATPKPFAPLAPGEEKTVLHIGWSSALPERLHPFFRQPGWKAIRMDVNTAVNPDIPGVFTDLSAVASNFVDAIWCPHILQRFFAHEALAGLRECFRVLKEEGRLMTAVPDGQLAATYLAHNRPYEAIYESPAGPVNAIDMLYGYGPSLQEGKAFMAHRTAYTQESLGLAIREAGFTNITVQRDGTDIAAAGYKFRYDHPNRVERVTQSRSPRTGALPKPPAIPAPVGGVPTSGAKGAASPTSDWLDAPPVIWKPLGLRQEEKTAG